MRSTKRRPFAAELRGVCPPPELRLALLGITKTIATASRLPPDWVVAGFLRVCWRLFRLCEARSYRLYVPFWKALQDLDVPLYIHPNAVPSDDWNVLRGYPELDTATWSWAARTGGHAMRLIFGGVFDRFPGARIILGHMGEFLPFQLWHL
jgi:predicted TIM-barrel fold metal-dependent hydrolase